MENNRLSVSLNGNKGASCLAQPLTTGGCQTLARQPRQRESMGARGEQTGPTQTGADSPDHSRSVGGQASLGLFGCGPSITGKPRRAFKEVADDQARQIGGLTFAQRRARLGVDVAAVGARFAHVKRQPLPFAPSMETLMVLTRAHIKREREESAAPAPKPTPAMRETAAASDMREAFPFFHDAEQPWERHTLFGHADLALANN